MKSVTYKNIVNGEQVVCDDTRNVEVIDGVEYLLVYKKENQRRFLMRKGALEKISEKKKKVS